MNFRQIIQEAKKATDTHTLARILLSERNMRWVEQMGVRMSEQGYVISTLRDLWVVIEPIAFEDTHSLARQLQEWPKERGRSTQFTKQMEDPKEWEQIPDPRSLDRHFYRRGTIHVKGNGEFPTSGLGVKFRDFDLYWVSMSSWDDRVGR